MIIKLKEKLSKNELLNFEKTLKEKNIEFRLLDGGLLYLTGDTARLDADTVNTSGVAENFRRLTPAYNGALRQFHPDDTVIDVCGIKIGGGETVIIGGPCTVESEEQIVTIAKQVKLGGGKLLRGGAYKPRSSPHSFQGLREEGLKYLLSAKLETGLPTVSEIPDATLLPLFADVDILQVGARNMQNYELLKSLGRQEKPVLLKRGFAATYEELLMSAEYIISNGNPNVILCERGIRSFDNYTRNVLDISAIPALKTLSHLPVFADPSHASGRWNIIKPLCYAATAAGADGLILEVHNDPSRAICDGSQSVKPALFGEIVKGCEKISEATK